ncbi:hypothetical protein B0O99DRAFT_744238 [Bisporella sp. PMI_857]|nr:hypothetical protein B0O99DRAFT_744238 [Bisporella sp. PMI_857]
MQASRGLHRSTIVSSPFIDSDDDDINDPSILSNIPGCNVNSATPKRLGARRFANAALFGNNTQIKPTPRVPPRELSPSPVPSVTSDDFQIFTDDVDQNHAEKFCAEQEAVTLANITGFECNPDWSDIDDSPELDLRAPCPSMVDITRLTFGDDEHIISFPKENEARDRLGYQHKPNVVQTMSTEADELMKRYTKGYRGGNDKNFERAGSIVTYEKWTGDRDKAIIMNFQSDSQALVVHPERVAAAAADPGLFVANAEIINHTKKRKATTRSGPRVAKRTYQWRTGGKRAHQPGVIAKISGRKPQRAPTTKEYAEAASGNLAQDNGDQSLSAGIPVPYDPAPEAVMLHGNAPIEETTSHSEVNLTSRAVQARASSSAITANTSKPVARRPTRSTKARSRRLRVAKVKTPMFVISDDEDSGGPQVNPDDSGNVKMTKADDGDDHYGA